MNRICRTFVLLALLAGSGCASIGCEINPLSSRKMLSCEMPV